MTSVSNKAELITAINDANINYPSLTIIDLTDDIDLDTVQGSLFGSVGTPVVVGRVIINGNGYTIARTGVTELRLFSITGKTGNSSASLVLNNVCLSNGNLGSSAGSGAIINDGYLEINDCTISNCSGVTNGGAIYNGDSCTMIISRSIFLSNTATGSNARGGAIYNSSGSSLTIKDTVFADNKALGTGSRGGAIYRHSGGSVQIINSSFCGNQAPSGFHIYNNGTLFDAKQNWWGKVNGPDSGTAIVGSIYYEPYRTTLPRFIPTPSITENPCLPSIISGCKLKILENESAYVYLGPSDDDLYLRYSNGQIVILEDTDEIDVRAYASDENNEYWYGYEDTVNRPNYLSWVKSPTAYLDNCENDNLTDFSTQSHYDYSDSLVISNSPVRVLDGSSLYGPVKGFGLDEPQYSNFPGSRHPGIDFFPEASTNRDFLAVSEGIVVGMGRFGISNQPTPWGSVGNGLTGYNLIIRTNGYFLLYGHLEVIESSLYLGARVFPNDFLGVIIEQEFSSNDNTHIHLEVRVFNEEFMGAEPLRCRFGALKASPGQVPGSGPGSGKTPQAPIVIDPMKFVLQRGTPGSPSGDNTPFDDAELLNDQEQVITFDYEAATDLIDNGFDITLTPFNVLTSYPPEDPAYCFD